MKQILTMLGVSCFYFLADAGPTHVTCGDEISLIQHHYSISYGDTIEAGVALEHEITTSWSISPASGVNKASGSGKTTGDLIFSQPGKYQITFQIPAHGDHPAKTETALVEVSNVKMIFDTQKISFSRPLTTGDASGVIMTVPVEVKTYDSKPYDYTTREVQTTGVGRVSSRLKDGRALLKEGQNLLPFELSGSVSQQGNIQFRVYDDKGEAVFFNYSITN